MRPGFDRNNGLQIPMNCPACAHVVPEAQLSVRTATQRSLPTLLETSLHRPDVGMEHSSVRSHRVLVLLVPLLPVINAVQLRLPLRTSLLVREAVSRAADDPRIVAQRGQPIQTHWNIAGYQRTNESGWSEGRVWVPFLAREATLCCMRAPVAVPDCGCSRRWSSVRRMVHYRPAGASRYERNISRSAGPGVPRARRFSGNNRSQSVSRLLPSDARTRRDGVATDPIAEDSVDRSRDQLVAELVVSSMRRRLPALSEDPEAILLGVTEQDMYIGDLHWNYAFSYRADERFALVSTARMAPPFQALWPRSEVLRSRLRKMLMKDIGMLVYRSRPTTIPAVSCTGMSTASAISITCRSDSKDSAVRPS